MCWTYYSFKQFFPHFQTLISTRTMLLTSPFSFHKLSSQWGNQRLWGWCFVLGLSNQWHLCTQSSPEPFHTQTLHKWGRGTPCVSMTLAFHTQAPANSAFRLRTNQASCYLCKRIIFPMWPMIIISDFPHSFPPGASLSPVPLWQKKSFTAV